MAEQHGLSSVWIPQVPDEFDAMTAAALVAHSTDRIEVGTAVVALQTRHPVALVQQALSTQLSTQGRFALRHRARSATGSSATWSASR